MSIRTERAPKDVTAARNSQAASDLEIEQELAQTNLERNMFSRLLPLLSPFWPRIGAVVVLELLLVSTIFLRPYFVGRVVDDGILRDGDAVTVNVSLTAAMVVGLAVSWAFRFGLSGFSQFIAGGIAIQLLNDLRRRVFAHVQTLSVRYFDRAKAGRIVSRADRDVDTLEPLLVQGPPELISAILRCGVAGFLLYQISVTLFLSVATIVPILVPAIWAFHRIASSNWGRVAERRSRFTSHLVETVNGFKVIQQSRREQANRQQYDALLRDFTASLIRGNVRSGWFLPLTAILSTTGMAIVLVVGGQGVARGEMTLGQLTSALFYIYLFLGPLQELGDLFERYAAGTAAAQRIFLLLDTVPEIVDRESAVSLSQPTGQVEFENVTFGYDTKRRAPVIRNFSLTVPAGQRVAIVGPTGHGKSTLVQLLTRFYEPQSGRVLVDGLDIRDLEQKALRKIVGVVLQDNVLFSGSVRDNLRAAVPDVDDATIEQAAADLGIDEILQRLPRGYDTEVGALGANLSHGQRQMVCLLRAYLSNPSVLVLDEATSAIDIQTERRIQRALRRLCHGRTAIVIAHRLATIRDADRIAVIQNGVLVEFGSHNELLAKNGLYTEIHQAYEQGRAAPRPTNANTSSALPALGGGIAPLSPAT